jgi:hypothetical protein
VSRFSTWLETLSLLFWSDIHVIQTVFMCIACTANHAEK